MPNCKRNPLALIPPLLVLIACGTAGQSLDDLLKFEDPRACTAGPDFQRLLNSLHVIDDSGERFRLGVPRVPPRFAGLAGEPVLKEGSSDEQIVTLPLNGTWHGLPVRAIERTAKAETDWLVNAIVFDASREAVLEAANAAGFDLPSSGRRTNDDELELTIAVTGDENTARLWCGT